MKAIYQDNKWTIGVPKRWRAIRDEELRWIENYDKLDDSKHYNDGWKELRSLPFDRATQNKANTLSEHTDENNVSFYAYAVTDKTLEEIEVYQKSLVPQTVKKMNLRLALIESGISLNDIKIAIDAITDETIRESTLTRWEYAEFYERDNEMLIQLATSIGVNETQLDDIFKLAETL